MHNRWILPGRALWILLAINSIITFALTLGIVVDIVRSPSARLMAGLAEYGFSREAYGAIFVLTMTMVFAVYFVVALLIFLRRPNDGYALFSAIFLVSFGAAIAYPEIDEFLRIYQDPPAWYAAPMLISTLTSWPMLIAFLVLFPDGRFVPRWSLVLAAGGFTTTTAWGLNPGAFSDFASPLGAISSTAAVVLIGGSLYAQAWRYRHHFSSVQRQQAKWFVYGLAIVLVFTALYFALSILLSQALSPSESIWKDIVTSVTSMTPFVLLPVAIGLAILRYRLWDIDLIIRKTLVYSALTALLAAIYFSSVILLQRLVSAVTGIEQSALAIVISTLVIAALFTPLRWRIQNGIDRRFFRKKYDAQQVLAQFAVTARDETDLDALLAELVRVVDETLQPEHVSVWLRETELRNGDLQ